VVSLDDADLLKVLARIADGIDDLRVLTKSLVGSNATAKTAVPVEEAAQLLACSRSKIFQLLKSSKLKRAAGPGRATLVTVDSINSYLNAPTPKLHVRKHQAPRDWVPVDRKKLGA
jgi:hypothetical protein